MESVANLVQREPWNKGNIVGQKAPFKLQAIWALRVRLQMEGMTRDLALLNLGIDSKLRGCDLVGLRVDICHGNQVAARAVVMQHKTQRPVQFEITPATREAVLKVDQAGATEVGRLSLPLVAFMDHHIWGCGSTLELSMAGSRILDLPELSTAHIRCGGPRPR